MEKAYSIDGETFDLENEFYALQALDEAGRLTEGAVYYEIYTKPVDPCEYMNADMLLDQAQDSLCNDIGEAGLEFFYADSNAFAELDALLATWAAKHLSDRTAWKCVGKARKIKVTAEDIAEFHRG
jgi:hypothetical protein